MDIADLERARDVATARLATAEAFSWPLCILAGVCAHFLWGGWMLPIGAAVLVRYFLVRPYSRHYDAAHDAWERATGTGRYYTDGDR